MRINFKTLAFVANLTNFAYEKIFHEKMGDEVSNFLKNLSYLFIGTFVATVIAFVSGILAARILGPAEYGKIALVSSTAAFLSVPMLMGFVTAIVKYTSDKNDIERQSKIISTAYVLILLFTIVSVVICLIFSRQLSTVFSIPHELFYLALIVAVLSVFYTLTTNTLRGLFKMKTFAIFQVIYPAIILLAFLFFVFANNLLSFKSMVYSILLANGIIGVILLIFPLRKYLIFKFDRPLASTLTKYSVFAVAGSLSFVFYTNIDKILVNRYMTAADVGIYQAYLTASIGIAGLLWAAVNAVFFPTVSKYRDKGPVFNRINRLIPYLIGLGIPFILVCEFIILKLFGNQYPINLLWMILFAVAGICVVVDGVYGWLLSSVGRQGVKITVFGAIILALANIGLNIILIPRIGITGAILGAIVSYIASIAIVLYFGREYLRGKKYGEP